MQSVQMFLHIYLHSIERIKKDLREYFKNKEKQGQKGNIASQTIIKGNKRRNTEYKGYWTIEKQIYSLSIH